MVFAEIRNIFSLHSFSIIKTLLNIVAVLAGLSSHRQERLTGIFLNVRGREAISTKEVETCKTGKSNKNGLFDTIEIETPTDFLWTEKLK